MAGKAPTFLDAWATQWVAGFHVVELVLQKQTGWLFNKGCSTDRFNKINLLNIDGGSTRVVYSSSCLSWLFEILKASQGYNPQNMKPERLSQGI